LKQTGVPELGTDDRVLRFHEKPRRPPSNWRCPPLYFFQDSVAAALEAFLATVEKRDAPGHFIAYLCRQQPVYAFRLAASSLDIGSIDTYRRADRLLRRHPV
jgi:dTDP-glucose pyrophosphorylase